MNAFDAAEKNGEADALRGELEALVRSQNRSGRDDHVMVGATLLRVTVTVWAPVATEGRGAASGDRRGVGVA